MKQKLKVVKIGGKLIDDESRLEHFLQAFARLQGNKILVHGGGSLASRISRQLGVEPQMVEGRRITSADDIRIVTMVYAGWINKKIVAVLQQKNCRALGLSGADGNVIQAVKRPVKKIDYGFAGDIDKINTSLIKIFIEQKITPVFSAITHNGEGQLLNTNSDTVAAEIAIAMTPLFETELVYCFEKAGVLQNSNDESTVIRKLSKTSYLRGKEKGWFHDGILPKLHTGFDALNRGVRAVHIGNEKMLEHKRQKFTQLILSHEN